MPRFVILRHELADRDSHWDVMLERADGLMTWSINSIPANGEAVEARRLPDHRSIYLDYEGPVSRNRGHVRRWDAGTYEFVCPGDRVFSVRVQGNQLNGLLHFEQIDVTDDWQVKLESDQKS